MKKPIIGVVLDHEQSGGYSAFPWYALRENYFASIARAGGVPVAIPYAPDLVQTYAEMIDGLLVPGGAFDIHPSHYGKSQENPTQLNKENRTHFEMKLAGCALEKGLPFLGICAGMQLLNVMRGGTLYQDIAAHIPHALPHEQTLPKDEPSHPIHIVPGTLLHRIAGVEAANVNSTHHQAVDAVGKGLNISATAPDTVIECVEDESLPFCLGVEWHPEYGTTALDQKIFAAFTAKAGSR
ncbi:MAG: gamma-glutamyl-gamma-aminobutyrate hydrolase [Candidatus Puniceispirillum sp.]|nr:gamma-glutamyl-gamma-aminobutyrate hydrolase [Candidatus Puniceispirillum sp.]